MCVCAAAATTTTTTTTVRIVFLQLLVLTPCHAKFTINCRLFSICRFREVTGAYPEKITMVSFTFKQRRFETMHAQALRWPASRFHYVGLDPPASAGFDLAAATNGEYQNAAKPFEEDPYGCHSEILQQKRKQRNPFSRTPPYSLSCPEMKDLLQYCGPELIDPAKVPWKNLRWSYLYRFNTKGVSMDLEPLLSRMNVLHSKCSVSPSKTCFGKSFFHQCQTYSRISYRWIVRK